MAYPALRAYSKPRMRVAGTPPASFSARSSGLTPAGILALTPAAWYRYGLGITTATGVSQWNDQSGNNRHLVQATGASQPALQGDNSILFDGVAHLLQFAGFAQAQPNTYYLLFKPVSWTSNDNLFDGTTDATGKQLVRQTNGGASPNIEMFGGATIGVGFAGPAIGSYGVVTAVYNGVNSVLQTNLGSQVAGDAGANAMTGLTLGARGTPAGFSNIQVKEFIIFPGAHDAVTRSRVISYLNKLGSL